MSMAAACSALHRIMPPRGPRRTLCVVKVTTSAYGTGLGMAIAKEICMLGEPFDAHQAKAWGLVTKVVPHEKLMDEAMALARKLNSKAPIAVRMTKQALHRAHDISAEQFIDMQNTMNTKLRYTADAKEALAAFIEKRPAKFQNK